jgi:hypothetical protein
LAAHVETFIPQRKPTTPSKVAAPLSKRAKQEARPRPVTAVDGATAPARFSHISFARTVVSLSHLSDTDLLAELNRRMPRIPQAMMLSHLDTARAVLAQCATRVGSAACIANEPAVRSELGRLIKDWGSPQV